MKKRLWITAVITAPIIALYGASPFYVFRMVDVRVFIQLFAIFTGAAMVLWTIHIYQVLKYPGLNNVARFLIAYVIITTLIFLARKALPQVSDQIKPMDQRFSFYPILTSFLPNLIIMIMCNSIYSGFKRSAAESEVQELKLQHNEARMQVLTQQLQPHFLFNALSVLKSLISSHPAAAEEYTLKLSHFLQYAIQAKKEDLVPLAKELGFALDYIDLQKVRFGNAVVATVDIPKSYYPSMIPIFALQTLIENIFKHNQFTEKKPLSFGIYCLNDQVIVTNKKNLARGVEQNHTGLANLNSRYELIANAGIEISETENEFTVKLPLINK